MSIKIKPSDERGSISLYEAEPNIPNDLYSGVVCNFYLNFYTDNFPKWCGGGDNSGHILNVYYHDDFSIFESGYGVAIPWFYPYKVFRGAEIVKFIKFANDSKLESAEVLGNIACLFNFDSLCNQLTSQVE